MSKIDDGGPAFPCFVADGTIREEVDIDAREVSFHPGGKHVSGMSIRDYFAGQALCGTLTNSAAMMRVAQEAIDRRGDLTRGERLPLIEAVHHLPTVARSAYAFADAMLAARKSGGAA